MTRKELVDKLTRAYEMEETMASMLLEVIQQLLPSIGLSQEKKKRVMELFSSIQSDTLRHKAAVAKVVEQLSQGEYHV